MRGLLIGAMYNTIRISPTAGMRARANRGTPSTDPAQLAQPARCAELNVRQRSLRSPGLVRLEHRNTYTSRGLPGSISDIQRKWNYTLSGCCCCYSRASVAAQSLAREPRSLYLHLSKDKGRRASGAIRSQPRLRVKPKLGSYKVVRLGFGQWVESKAAY